MRTLASQLGQGTLNVVMGTPARADTGRGQTLASLKRWNHLIGPGIICAKAIRDESTTPVTKLPSQRDARCPKGPHRHVIVWNVSIDGAGRISVSSGLFRRYSHSHRITTRRLGAHMSQLLLASTV